MQVNSTWDEAKWQRYGLFAGVVFVVLNIVSTFAGGAPPSRDASAEEIGKYFLEHDGGLKLGVVLFGVALIFGVWWLGSLWRVIGGLEPSGPRLALIALIGFVMAGSLASGAQALFATPAMRTDSLVGASEFAWTAGYALYSLTLACTAVHMLALMALIMWKRFLPMWMGWLALVSAIMCTLAIGGAGSEASFFLVTQMIGFLTWMLWVLLASVLLATRKTT